MRIAICFTHHMSRFEGYSHPQSWFLETFGGGKQPKIPQSCSVVMWTQMCWEGAFKAPQTLRRVMSSPVEQWCKGRRSKNKIFPREGQEGPTVAGALRSQAAHLSSSQATTEPTPIRFRGRATAGEALRGEHGWWRKCFRGSSRKLPAPGPSRSHRHLPAMTGRLRLSRPCLCHCKCSL